MPTLQIDGTRLYYGPNPLFHYVALPSVITHLEQVSERHYRVKLEDGRSFLVGIPRQLNGIPCIDEVSVDQGKGHPKPTNAYTFPSGKRHPNWKGGSETRWSMIANIIYQEFHTSVICERCGTPDKIVIHHKDQNRSNNDIGNLQALCRGCHATIHKEIRNGKVYQGR